MVDLSDRAEIKRWLEAIKPAKRRREVAMATAARAALRCLPQDILQLYITQSPTYSEKILAAFRAGATAWVAGRYPQHRKELRAASAAFRALDRGNVSEAAVAGAAGYASLAAASSTVGDATHAAVYAIASAIFGPMEAAAANVIFSNNSKRYWARNKRSFAKDVDSIRDGSSSAEIVSMPLWSGQEADVGREELQSFRPLLLSMNMGWEVWTDWYEARLAGDAADPPNEALEVARATIPDEIWKRSPAVVNAAIKRLIDEHQSLRQRPAAFQFQVVDDKVDALPDDARPIDAETARDFYDEAKRKGQDLKDRLQRTQADENIRAHVDLLLVRLGSSYAGMRPGLMLSALRSLESDVRAYDGEEGRKELSAAHLSNIVDLANSVRDLCAIFPRSREIEAEAVSLNLPMQRMPEIRGAIGSVIAKVNASDGATERGRAAINASATDLAHQRSLAEEARQSAYFLVDFANFARAGVKHLKATGRAVGGEIASLGADSWRAVRRGAPKGIERGAAQAGKALVVGGVAALMHWLGSDIAALGTMVGPYLPLHEMLVRMKGAALSAPAPEPDARPTSSETANDAPTPRSSKPRKPKVRGPKKP